MDIKVGNNSRYKLSGIWSKICRSGKNGFESKEEFTQWAFNSGYKPWKNIVLLSENGLYSADNCVWEVTSKGSGAVKPLDSDLTPDNIVKNVRTLSINIVDAKVLVDDILNNCYKFKQLNIIDSKSFADLNKSLKLASEMLNDAYHTVDNMEVYGVTDNISEKEQ